jgi:hypothetical protein
MGPSKFMILVPLFDLKSLGSFRRLRCWYFKSAALDVSGAASCRFGLTVTRAFIKAA